MIHTAIQITQCTLQHSHIAAYRTHVAQHVYNISNNTEHQHYNDAIMEHSTIATITSNAPTKHTTINYSKNT